MEEKTSEQKEQEFVNSQTEALTKIAQEVQEINKAIQRGYAYHEAEEVQSLLERFSTYLARTDFLLSDAKYYLNQAGAFYSEHLDQKISATRFREILAGKLALYQKVFDQCERTNATIKQLLPTLTTQLSYLKEQMRQR